MSNVDVVVEQFDRMMQRLKWDRDRFLLEVAKWWNEELKQHHRAEPVPRDPDNPAHPDRATTDDPSVQKERLMLFYEIEHENVLGAGRHRALSDRDFRKFEQKVKALIKKEDAGGFAHTHPSVLGEYARGALRARKLDLAEELFRQSLDMLATSKKAISRRDLVLYQTDYSRCAYLAGEHPEAIKRAEKALDVAERIDREEEAEGFRTNNSFPYEFRPAVMFAYFGLCDAYVQSPDWVEDRSVVRGYFNEYWTRSEQELGTPESWHPLLKIYSVSDDLWLGRLNSYVADIAEKLFVQMGNNSAVQFFRAWRVRLWGIMNRVPQIGSTEYGLQKAAAVLLITGAALGSVRSLSSQEPQHGGPAVMTMVDPEVVSPEIRDLARSTVERFESNKVSLLDALDVLTKADIGGVGFEIDELFKADVGGARADVGGVRALEGVLKADVGGLSMLGGLGVDCAAV